MHKHDEIRTGMHVAGFLAVVWSIAAFIRPDSTFHLAPLLIAGVAPLAVKGVHSPKAGAIAVASALAIALSTGSLLSIAGRLQGPTLLPYGGAYAEALSFAAVGAAIGGLVLIVSRTTDSRAAV